MFKKLLSVTISLSLLVAAAPALAETTTAHEPVRTNTSNGALSTTTQLRCVSIAVSTRESTLDAAESAYSAAVSAAYSTRSQGLEQAYAQTSGTALRTAIKNDWATFTTSNKAARKTWLAARASAWTTFNTSIKSCKATAIPTDGANASLELSQ